jgi:hypothetical protein
MSIGDLKVFFLILFSFQDTNFRMLILSIQVRCAAIAASRTEVLGSYCSVKAVNDSLSIAVT